MAIASTDDTRPEVSWGGIFSGVFMVFGLQFLFTILGAGIGFSVFEPFSSPSQGAAIGAGIYFFVTMLISFYFGGYVAARFAGPRFRINAALHGITVWAIVLALAAFTFGSSMKSLLGGGFNMAGQAAQENIVIAPDSTHAPAPKVQAPKITPEQKAQIQRQAREAAGTARHVVAGGSWYFFVTFLVGLIVAALGGSFGGSYFQRQIRRTL